MTFLDPHPPTPTPSPRRAYVHPARRDGRHPVTFVYPVTGRQIKKLIPAARLDQAIAGYAVIYVAR